MAASRMLIKDDSPLHFTARNSTGLLEQHPYRDISLISRMTVVAQKPLPLPA